MKVLLAEKGKRRFRPYRITEFYGHRLPLLTLPEGEGPLPAACLRAFKKQAPQVVLACGPVEKHRLPQTLFWAEGFVLQGVLVRQRLHLALETLGIASHEAAVTVIDGGHALLPFVLRQLAPEVNRLSLCSLRPQVFLELQEELLAQLGLSLPVYASPANPLFREAHVVVCLSPAAEEAAFYLKEGACFMDLWGGGNLRRLLARREDVLPCPNLPFYWEETPVSPAEAETLLFLEEDLGELLFNARRQEKTAVFLLQKLEQEKFFKKSKKGLVISKKL